MGGNFAELPRGWKWATYEQIGKWSGGGTPSKRIDSYWSDGDIPWISPKDMKSQIIYDSEDKITEVAVENSPAKLIPSGSLLFVVRSGILRRTLPVALTKINSTINQDLKALKPYEYIFDEYLLYHALAFNEEIRHDCAKDGTTVESIEFSALKEYRVPIAPLPEQHRIVAKIEELFSHLDAGVEGLHKVKAQLRRYRQAVLKAAVDGRLTEDWRRANRDVEPASEILRKIRKISDPTIRNQTSQEKADNSGLPEGWVWAKFDQIGEWSGGGTPSKRNASYWTNGSILWVSPKDMKSTKIYDSQDKITLDALENSSAKLIQPGSLLFVVRSGIIQRMLPIASLKVKGAVNQDLKALTPDKGINEDYLLYSTMALAENIRNNCSKDGTTVQSIEFKLLRNFLIPIPPFKEQQEIVNEIESNQSSLFEVEMFVDASLKNTDRLRQSILKRAFEGTLVPQNPNDEAASALLDRIMNEKAIQARRTKGSKNNGAKQMRLIQ